MPGRVDVITSMLRPNATEPGRAAFGRHRRLVLGTAAVVALVALLVWLVAVSPVFGVRTVAVEGAHSVAAARVRAAAGVTRGTPLVRLRAASIAHRVEAALPEVADARVSTSFPSTVTITLREREPVGYVRHGKSLVLVDGTGAQFETVSRAPRQLPLFVLADGSGARAAGAAVATVAAALPTRIRAEVVSIRALRPDAITLLLDHHRVVTWGTAAHSAEKARVLAALLPRKARQINLTDPDQPYTR